MSRPSGGVTQAWGCTPKHSFRNKLCGGGDRFHSNLDWGKQSRHCPSERSKSKSISLKEERHLLELRCTKASGEKEELELRVRSELCVQNPRCKCLTNGKGLVLLCEACVKCFSSHHGRPSREERMHASFLFSPLLFRLDLTAHRTGRHTDIHDASPPQHCHNLPSGVPQSPKCGDSSPRGSHHSMSEKSNPIPFPLSWRDLRDVLSKKCNFLIIQKVLIYSEDCVLYYEGNNLLKYL